MEEIEKQVTLEEVIDAINKSGGRVIERPAVVPPQEVDTSGFKSEVQKYVESFARTCEEYLSKPLIIDKYGNDHEARRGWRRIMEYRYRPVFRPFYETNKLKMGNIYGVHGYLIEALPTFFEMHNDDSQKANSVRELVKQLPDISNYNQLTQDERLAVVEKMKNVCRRYLAIVAAQPK